MPRMQVYLPDDLYAEVKEQGLPASELLQKAVREELRRIELIKAGEEYLADLIEEFGEPSLAAEAWAKDILDQALGHSEQAAS